MFCSGLGLKQVLRVAAPWYVGELQIALPLQLGQSRSKLQSTDQAGSDGRYGIAPLASCPQDAHAACHLGGYNFIMINVCLVLVLVLAATTVSVISE
jgi:hypothetical protein